MTDMQSRGYLISNAATYLREGVGPDEWARISATFSPALQQAIATAKPAGWYPIALLTEVNRAIASSLGRGDEALARDALYKCGKFAAHEATNSFLRLLMRMLSPTLFAKKLPDFFRRDFTSGRLEVEVTETSLTCRMFDVPGFEHAGVLGPGFASFPLEAMGKKIEGYTVHKWSLDAPNVDGTWYEIVWAN